jgi:hypothetical protein
MVYYIPICLQLASSYPEISHTILQAFLIYPMQM